MFHSLDIPHMSINSIMDKRLVYYSVYINFWAKLGILPFEMVHKPELQFRIKQNVRITYLANLVFTAISACHNIVIGMELILEETKPAVVVILCGILGAFWHSVGNHLFILKNLEELLGLFNKVINAHPQGKLIPPKIQVTHTELLNTGLDLIQNMILELMWLGIVGSLPFCFMLIFATQFIGFNFYVKFVRSVFPESLIGQYGLILVASLGTSVTAVWSSVIINLIPFIAYNVALEVKGLM